jgi:hypothetical protein
VGRDNVTEPCGCRRGPLGADRLDGLHRGLPLRGPRPALGCRTAGLGAAARAGQALAVRAPGPPRGTPRGAAPPPCRTLIPFVATAAVAGWGCWPRVTLPCRRRCHRARSARTPRTPRARSGSSSRCVTRWRRGGGGASATRRACSTSDRRGASRAARATCAAPCRRQWSIAAGRCTLRQPPRSTAAAPPPASHQCDASNSGGRRRRAVGQRGPSARLRASPATRCGARPHGAKGTARQWTGASTSRGSRRRGPSWPRWPWQRRGPRRRGGRRGRHGASSGRTSPSACRRPRRGRRGTTSAGQRCTSFARTRASPRKCCSSRR